MTESIELDLDVVLDLELDLRKLKGMWETGIDAMDVVDHLEAAEGLLRAAGLSAEADKVAALIEDLRIKDDTLDALADVIEVD